MMLYHFCGTGQRDALTYVALNRAKRMIRVHSRGPETQLEGEMEERGGRHSRKVQCRRGGSAEKSREKLTREG